MPVDTSSSKEKAKVAVERRNYPYAIEIYQTILEVEPNDVEVRRSLRAVELRQAKELGTSRAVTILKNLPVFLKLMIPSKNYERVMITCEKYLASDPTNARILKKLANVAFAAGHRETAEVVLEDLRQSNAEDVEGLRMLQAVCSEMGNHKKALDVNRDILKIVPDDREASQAVRDLSATDMSAKFEEAAISGERGRASRTVLKDEKDAERLSRDLRTKEDVLAEIEDVKGDIKEKPDDSRLYVKVGNLQLRLRAYDDAQAAFEKAKELSPTEYTVTMKLQDVDIARMRDAAGKLGRAWKSSPQDAGTKAAYREAYTKLLLFRLECFEAREKQFPTELAIAFELGNIYFEMKKLDEAIKRYQRTIHDPKNRSQSLLNLGIAFQKKKQHDLALKQFTEGIEYIEIWNEQKMGQVYQRGDCYEEMGEKDKAIADFTSIYEKDISFRDVRKRIEILQKG